MDRCQQALRDAIAPSLKLLPERMDSPEARTMLLAIGLQESRLKHMRQLGGGPARGLPQFERGGITGVLRHDASREHAKMLCTRRGVVATPTAVWLAMEHDAPLGMGFARLLLWTDPAPLPAMGDTDGAWDYYLRNWRPGKPHPDTWRALHHEARMAVIASMPASVTGLASLPH